MSKYHNTGKLAWIKRYCVFFVQKYITPCTVVITSVLVREKPLGSPASVKRVYWRYWSAKGGTMVVQGRQKRCSNWYTMFTTVRIFTGRPMADHCASILPPWRCVCLPPASFERPVSDRPLRRPLCDCFEHAQNFTATMASMAMSERPVYHHWTTKATVLPPFCHQRRPGQFCGRTMEAERSQPLCKGGISAILQYPQCVSNGDIAVLH